MKLLDLINSLATKVGKQNDKAMIDLLSRADLQNIDFADDIANSINNGLLTIEGAKNNIAVKNHYVATALSPVDEHILSSARNFGLDDDFIAELTANKSTYEKQKRLADKLKETFDVLKASQSKDKDVEKYAKQINELTAQLMKLKTDSVPKSELDKVKKEGDKQVLDFMLQSKLSGLKYANTDVPTDVNTRLARIILDEALTKKDVVLVKEGNEIKLKQAKEPSLDYYDQSQKTVGIDDFLSKTLADAKILAVSNSGEGNPQPPSQPTVPIPNGQVRMGGADFMNEISKSLGNTL